MALDTWLRPADAGKYLGDVSTGTLANWRSAGTGPPFTKVNGGIRYSLRALDKYLADRTKVAA